MITWVWRWGEPMQEEDDGNWTCEASASIDRTGHSPRIILCNEPAKIRNKKYPLCDEHAHLAK